MELNKSKYFYRINMPVNYKGKRYKQKKEVPVKIKLSYKEKIVGSIVLAILFIIIILAVLLRFDNLFH
ncbi:hypothetical protein EC396_08710 [Lutibacter sp. HS1-25]|nr:hypothetical protein EC396_08710 [Lutibacter sp. HS1-25]